MSDVSRDTLLAIVREDPFDPRPPRLVQVTPGETLSGFVDRLGFDLTTSFGGQAIFVSAGGYHHHMAMNVWRSAGAGRRMPALGLGQVDISLPKADELGATAERLQHHGVAVRDDGRTLELDDPWGTRIRLASA